MCQLPLPHHKPWNGNQEGVFLCWDGQHWNPSDFGDIDRKAIDSRKLTAYKQGQARREEFLGLLIEGIPLGHGVTDVTRHMGISFSTYTRWRQKYPRFAAEVDLARESGPAERMEYTGGFESFRRLYLRNESTWFQLQAVQALEGCKVGEIILLLWPPEHGKTTTIEDFCNFKLATAPQTRITVASEKQGHGIKVLRRVMNRMEPDGPTPLYVQKFGPFVPDDATGKRKSRQPWAADHFDVRQRGKFDERDYNMSAVGITTGVQGTRADWLIGDDLQSLKSLALTDSYFELLRQDFFSRPGMLGRICLLGTRVGHNDIYERLIEEGLIDRLIIFPAHDPEGRWLWPERYTESDYQRMRKRVGDQAWFRNFMQKPSAAKEATFSHEIVSPSFNTARSVIADAPQERDAKTTQLGIMPVCVNLDPALGSVNSITAQGFGQKQLYYLGSRSDEGFTRNEEIFDVLEQVIIRWNQPSVSSVRWLVIEAMNFQKGLVDDDRMREIKARYGVKVIPHLTGTNKYDENIGIPSMALSFMRGEIDLPYSDKVSQTEIDLFTQELYAWRPYKRGNRLRQDRVVSFWFGWIQWRMRRAHTKIDTSQFTMEASPLRRPA